MAVLVALGVLGILALRWRTAGQPTCADELARGESFGLVIVVCQAEYERTQAPETGALLAEALQHSGNRAAAGALANELLATEARADALWTLGQIALTEERIGTALGLLLEARALHRAADRRDRVARDALALAGIYEARGGYAEALYALDECIVEARAALHRGVEGRCHLAAARTLIGVGLFKSADRELEAARPLLATVPELAMLWFELGNVMQERSRGKKDPGSEELAVARFQKALEYASRGRLTELALSTELNLVASLTELPERLDEAAAHLAAATGLDRARDYSLVLGQLEARLAYRRGELPRADALNTGLYGQLDPGDERFELSALQARIALDRGRLDEAELWARRAVDDVERLRLVQTALELRPPVLASRRAAHELLFITLARAARPAEALAVFDRGQGHALLDAMIGPEHDAVPGLAARASQIQGLERLLPAASGVPLFASKDRRVVEGIRGIDLLAFAVAEDGVWRVVARRGGAIRIDRIGALTDLEKTLTVFKTAPADRINGNAAGRLLVPPELYDETVPLYVVLDAPLATWPIVAARHDGKPLIAARPVIRLVRLPSAALASPGAGAPACAAPAPGGRAVVLADAEDNLPEARKEAQAVAARLGATLFVGTAATSAALWSAQAAQLLHCAVHVDLDAGGGGVLRLRDRPVPALEVAAHRLAAPLVVLSGCNSAAAEDPEGTGALSTAFLAGGSSRVVATLRPIEDAKAAAVIGQFYAEGGAAQPVQALAAVQRKLVDTPNAEWPLFAVFEHEACVPQLSGGPR